MAGRVKNRKRLQSLLLAVIIALSGVVWHKPMEAEAASFSKSVTRTDLYSSGCLKEMTINIQAIGSYASAWGKIAIHTQPSKYSWGNRWTTDGSSNWPASIENDNFVTWGEGDEFFWSDGRACSITVGFNDGVIDLNKDSTYYVYLWTRAPSYGIYPDDLLYTLHVRDGKLLDDSGNIIEDVNNHIHQWDYAAGDGEIKAWCTKGVREEQECTYQGSENGITLELYAENATYSGSPYTGAGFTGGATWVNAGLGLPTIYYAGTGDTYYNSTTAPTNFGTYKAVITAKNNSTASQEFTIEKADPTFTAPTGLIINYNESAQNLVQAPQNVIGGTMKYSLDQESWSASIPTKVEKGTYTIYYQLIGDVNYNNSQIGSVESKIIDGVIEDSSITENNYEAEYDGVAHSATVAVSNPANTEITYSNTQKGEYKTQAPTFTDVSTNTVYYKIAKENYETKTGTLTVKINKRNITISGITAEEKIYDGNAIADLNYTNMILSGKLESEDLNASATGTFADKNAADGKTVNISALTLSGTDVGNYQLAEVTQQQTTTTANIKPKEVTVTPDSLSKTYTETDQTLTYTASGLVGDEVLNKIMITRQAGEDAGEYKITATQVKDANPNYKITFNEGTFTIHPKSIVKAVVTLGTPLKYTGEEQVQEIKKVIVDGIEVPSDAYEVTGNVGADAGAYKMTIRAKEGSNFVDHLTWSFVVAPTKSDQMKENKAGEIELGEGTIKVSIEIEGKVPKIELLTSKADIIQYLVDSGDLTTDEMLQIANGASIDVVLKISDASATITQKSKDQIANAASGYTIGQYIDISLFKQMTINGEEQEPVQLFKTSEKIKIAIQVPDQLINKDPNIKRTYSVIRNHDGEVSILKGAFDATTNTLTFETDRFSDYAIAYKDAAISNSTKSVQTGDNTNAILYGMLLLASFLTLFSIFVVRRKGNH